MDINVVDYGARPNSSEDTTPAVMKAIAACRGKDRARLVFPAGKYQFYRDHCDEHLLYTSNNDSGIKRVGLPLFGLRNIEVDGNGSQFIFHGRMVPVAVWNCSNVILRNFSIDWDRSFTLDAEVLDQKGGDLDLKISPATPYVVHDGILSGLDDNVVRQTQMYIIEFDPRKQEFVYDSPYACMFNVTRELEPGIVRVSGVEDKLRLGKTVCLRMELRHSPGMSIGLSSEVQVLNVGIHASAGMGLICQESRDVRVDGLRVTPAPGSGRLLSTQDDATHFCNCRGQIVMENCLLERCWDDGGNVHGTYRKIGMRGPHWTVSQVEHFQQMGVGMGQQDDDVYEFIDPATMQAVHQDKGFEYKVYNAHQMAMAYRHDLPDCVKVGMVLENISATPNLTVRNCRFWSTRPRGILINTRGKVVVEDNYFHTPGAGLLVGADANSWYESGAVHDLLIRRNVFDNCWYMRPTCTSAPIQITPVIPEAGRGRMFERNIRIEENTFRTYDGLVLQARSVDGLTFQNNVIEKNGDYPQAASRDMLDIDDCVSVKVEGNAAK